jgi:hypothetical protein
MAYYKKFSFPKTRIPNTDAVHYNYLSHRSPQEMGRKANSLKTKLLLLAFMKALKPIVSDPGISCPLPASRAAWGADTVTCQ